jgi:branched-chain amino acid aminotransferase
MPKNIWFNGQLVPPDQAKVGVYDHGLLYGDGVFEGIRVYNGRIFKCATHLQRLFESAQAIRLTIPYSIEELTKAIRDTITANGQTDCYIRLCVSRGEGYLGLSPFNCPKPNTFIIADSISLYPQEMYDNGMSVITASVIRNHPGALSPRIKSMNYLNNILAKIEAIDAGVPEAIMLNHMGFVAEATADNVFIVKKGFDGKSRVFTPPLYAGALEGVTMNTVISLAQKAGIEVIKENMTKHDLYIADEMFLTGTGAEVIAVTSIDNRTIASGKPGPITLQLNKAFRTLIAKDAPED